MGSIVELQLLALDSLKYSSKAKAPINRHAEAVIGRILILVDRTIYLFFCLSNFYFYFIWIAIATDVIGWPE